jgi:hypothetical protein
MVIFHSFLYVYQRVTRITNTTHFYSVSVCRFFVFPQPFVARDSIHSIPPEGALVLLVAIDTPQRFNWELIPEFGTMNIWQETRKTTHTSRVCAAALNTQKLQDS